MISALFQKKLVRTAAALAAVGAIAGVAAVGGSPAQADPNQFTAPIYGFGSDTTQDVMNALAGYSNGRGFLPLLTPTGNRQLVSWDAFPVGDCIATKLNSPTILRPNGSSNGHAIISSAWSPATDTWPFSGTSGCGANKNSQGLVDFARSSSGPGSFANATTGPLSWIPFARDALSFAYIRPTGATNPAVVSITTAQMRLLHSAGPQLINGQPVIACGIQTGSGTYSSWMGGSSRLTLAQDGTGDPGTATCNDVLGVPDPGGRLQESNGPELIAKSLLLGSMSHDVCDGVVNSIAAPCTNAQLVVGFSASQYVARSNLIGTPAPGLGANAAISGMGQMNGVVAVSGSGTTTTAGDYSGAFGRDVYNIVPYETINVALGTEVPYIVEMFVGPDSEICDAEATIQQHGFKLLGASCGGTTLRGNFRTTNP